MILQNDFCRAHDDIYIYIYVTHAHRLDHITVSPPSSPDKGLSRDRKLEIKTSTASSIHLSVTPRILVYDHETTIEGQVQGKPPSPIGVLFFVKRRELRHRYRFLRSPGRTEVSTRTRPRPYHGQTNSTSSAAVDRRPPGGPGERVQIDPRMWCKTTCLMATDPHIALAYYYID